MISEVWKNLTGVILSDFVRFCSFATHSRVISLANAQFIFGLRVIASSSPPLTSISISLENSRLSSRAWQIKLAGGRFVGS